MKIACISTSRVPSLTANSIQMMKVCHALAQTGAEVRVFLPDTGEIPPDWPRMAQHYGLRTPFDVTWLPSNPRLRRYDFAFGALSKAAGWQADMVYTWLLPAAVLASSRRLPVIFEVHDRVTGRVAPLLFRNLLRSGGRKRLLVITRALQQRLHEQFGERFSGVDVQIAPNGVDLAQYDNLPDAPTARRQLGLTEGLTALYSGHFYAGRGMDLLRGLAERFPQVHFLWLGGQHEDVQQWKTRLAGAGLTNVTLTGFVEQARLPLYQAAADILLMPYERVIAGSSGGNSADICSPMKMFDYLAAGRAIISSDLPVFHEVLDDSTACLVKFGETQADTCTAWQAALQSLVDEPVRRAGLGLNARQSAQRHTWIERARRALKNFA